MKNNKPIISLDGTKIQIVESDLDGDGVTGEIETLQRKDYGEQNIVQNGELKEVYGEMFNDKVDQESRMSALDMRTNLHRIEVPAMIVWDTLISMRVLPVDASRLTVKKSRYAISMDAMGRKDMKEVAIGKREQDAKLSGFAANVKNALGSSPTPTA